MAVAAHVAKMDAAPNHFTASGKTSKLETDLAAKAANVAMERQGKKVQKAKRREKTHQGNDGRMHQQVRAFLKIH